ncbi:MAG: MFS transporter [Treponema sp.]|jgi:predicted MFS family arabinose efflux permease|nr:MFS transporter [Treponema sp.]
MAEEKTNWFTVIMLWLAGIAGAMQFAKFSFAFDFLKNQYNVNSLLIGLSLSVVGLIGLIFGITISIYISRIGQNKILLISLFFGFIISLVQALNPIFPVMFFSRILEGISHLGIVVTAPAIMLLTSSKKHHSIVMGLWGSFFGIAFSITAYAGEPVMELYSISGLFFFHALLLLIIFIILFFLIEKMDIPHNESDKISFLTAHIKVYSNWRTFSPSMIFFFNSFMYIALLTFLPGLTGDDKTRELLSIALPLANIAGTITAGIVSQYFVSPSKLCIAAYMFLILLICIIKMSFNNNMMFVPASMVLMMFSGVIQGSVFSLIPNISLSAEDQTNANGAVAQLGNLGSTLGPPVFSYFLVYGKNSVIVIVMLLGILGAVSAMIITRKIKAGKI